MYGENSGHLRDAIGTLAREHRIQQRLGGKGSHTIPETTTPTERERLGQQIRRYRHTVLTWTLQAVRAANPDIRLEGRSSRTRGPAEELRYRLVDALNYSTVQAASLDELATSQPFATVESWREAARAAALGEHDFGAGVGHGRLSKAQAMTVLKDAADIVRGLVALDRRYDNVPGWEKLHNQGRLGRAAEACAAHAGYDDPDYTVDRIGWRPPRHINDHPVLPGLAGVVQAEYNALIGLGKLPNARALRVIVDAQRVVSHETADRLRDVDPELAAKWTTRSGVYTRLVHETRDLGGLLGSGTAAGHSYFAAARSQHLPHGPLTDVKLLGQLDRLFTGIDERITAAVEYGIGKRIYFQRVNAPGLDNIDGTYVYVTRSRYVPITSSTQTGLLDVVRHELRPPPVPLRPPKHAARSRHDFEAALHHRPPPKGATPDAPSL